MVSTSLKIFQYIADLDCFIVTEQYRKTADELGLVEWSPVVWIGRLFLMDNDVGEHWFDNWELREQLRPQAEQRGIAYEDLLIIDPQRFQNGADGPCHTAEVRKHFWTDVLRSLELSYVLLFEEARTMNTWNQQWVPESYLPDLEQRIDWKTYRCSILAGEAHPGAEPEAEYATAYSFTEVGWFDLRHPTTWNAQLGADSFVYSWLQRIQEALGYAVAPVLQDRTGERL